jgi:ATP-dependent RNA helicase DDX60
MKQILKEDDDGVLVYVAPTKALVNQIAAEIQARFSKSYPSKVSGKSVWAIHTRDYRINNPLGCQILVTVPHILQIMLLAPANANTWSPRVKRIIFDEIHCIGQTNDGVVWEQLLLLSPCPIIALSATVGNPQEFCDWLSLTQNANGVDLKLIEHRHRYSDLRKYIYNPPQIFSFTGFSDPATLPPLGLDDAPGMVFIHPVASLVDRSRGMPEDLGLEPRDCLALWKAMLKYQTENFPVDPSLDPFISLPSIIRKTDVIKWQCYSERDSCALW